MKKILVGLDASDRAPAVLSVACDFAAQSGAKLVLVRAVGLPVDLPAEAYRISGDSLTQLLQQEADKGLQELVKQIPSGLLDSTRVGIGVAWQVVCEAAKELDVDLIVIGSHGFSVLDRVLGTTAARVVNHADRSVLVVRAK